MTVILLRTLILFASLLFFMRLLGKRQLGELELSELVVSVLIADIAAHPLQDIGIPLLNGLLPVVVLFCCEMIVSGLTVGNLRFRDLMCGRPSILVENGQICQKEMRRNRFTLDELTEELRNQSVMDISKVKYAVLETDGKLNTILYPAERPVTASLLGVNTDDPGFPKMLINEGRVLSDNLKKMGLDMRWLEKELKRRKLDSPRQVYLLTINDAGQIYCALAEEKQ